MVEGANNVNVVVVPLPAIEPGLIVHAPAGNPLKATLPVGVVQVGCVIVPTTGEVGAPGATLTINAVADEIQPLTVVVTS